MNTWKILYFGILIRAVKRHGEIFNQLFRSIVAHNVNVFDDRRDQIVVGVH